MDAYPTYIQFLDFGITNQQDVPESQVQQVIMAVQGFPDTLFGGIKSHGFNSGGDLSSLNLDNVQTASDLSGSTISDNWYQLNISYNNALRDNFNLPIPTKYQCNFDPSYYFFKLSYFYQHLFRLQTLETLCQNQPTYYSSSNANLAVKLDFVETTYGYWNPFDMVKSIVDTNSGLYKYRIVESEKPSCIHHIRRIDASGNIAEKCDLSFYEFCEVASCVQITWSPYGQCVLGNIYKVAINQPQNNEGYYLLNIPFLPINNNVYQILNVADPNNLFYQSPSVYTWNNFLTFITLIFFSLTIFDLLYLFKNGNILLPYLEF